MSGFRMALLFCGAMIAVGVALVIIGHGMPVYTVPYEQAYAAFQSWCRPDMSRDAAAGESYRALFGWHYALMNAGFSLASAGLAAGLLAIGLRVLEPDLPWLRTPAHRWTFIAIGAGAVIGYLPGVLYGLSTDLHRQYFPWCADSIGIPLFGLTGLVMALTPILALIGWLFTLGFGALPARLSQWDADRPVRSWIATLIFGAAMLGALALWAMSLFSSDIISPSSVVILYLLASTRAALLSPRAHRDVRMGR